MTGTERIAAERQRQVEEEGYTTAHDDQHGHGEMAVVAAELAVYHTAVEVDVPRDAKDRWGLVRKHRADTIRRLTIAGALIAAEIDRLQRNGT